MNTSSTPRKAPQYQQFLDQRQIITTSLKYPGEVQQDFIWLAGYLRDACFGNMDVLEKQIRNLGFNTTGGTIGKIIVGRWIQDTRGNVTPPVLSYPNFKQIVDRLKSMDRASRLMGKVPFIKTSAWQKISDYIDERRAKDAVCKFGIILGPTGAQKGACAKHYCIENNHGACNYFEAPFKPSVRDFRSTLAKAFGVDYRASDREKAARLKEAINETRTIYIANIQRLYVPGAGWYQEIFNWLQEMQESTDCTVILEGVLEFQKSLQLGSEAGYFEQFEGRCGGDFLLLPQYPPHEDLLAIAAAFGLLPSPSPLVGEGRGEGKLAKQTIALLDQIVHERGRIRRLFHILQKGKRLANVQKEPMTLDHVREVYEDTPINVMLENDDQVAVAAPEPINRTHRITTPELASR